MMIPTVKLMLVLAIAMVVVVTTINASNKGKKTGNQKSVDNNSVELELRNAAQEALDAIGSKRKLSANYKRANRGQHVFNNGLLKLNHNVLEDLLKVVGGFDEQMENLVKDFMIPRIQIHRNAISTMVAHFSSEEFYVDFNADVYGEYARALREALVAFLKADISVKPDERHGKNNKAKQVQLIASQMVKHEVYVDPMACDRWLQKNQNHVQLYNKVREELKIRFQEILQDIKRVSDKIRDFLKRKNQ